ncbi:glycosyltransferase [Solilutibacter silvestris]|uniref:Glycosyltransferase n=1 Tax=Solilutibacter silvestris TaxID=1645665 RepID=A0A2K1PZC8_9GAMM|nr:glycosyltransferase [Lysobacter silvestris]PNS08148.1 Glycosyltransferase [Lysobacter silvestris]
MRPVVHLRSSAGLYGADRMVLALSRHLPAAGQPSRLVSIGNHHLGHSPLHEEACRRNQEAILLPSHGRLDASAVASLRGLLRSQQAGCIHAHDPKSVVYAWLATRGLDCRCVATTHGWVETGAALRLYNRIERALLKRYDAVAVVARQQVDRLIAAGVQHTRIHAIANGIELPEPASRLQRAEARRHYGCEPQDTVFAAIGRLALEKNFALLLKAMARIGTGAPIRLLVAGDGPEYSALAYLANALGLESQVTLLGHVDDCAPLYAAMDVLALPSLSEGMPLVVLEAMAAGKPVLASAVGDVPALLAHAPGSKVLPLDEAAWAQAMQAAIGTRVDDAAARAYVRDRHSAQVMAARYAELYRQLWRNDGVARAA